MIRNNKYAAILFILTLFFFKAGITIAQAPNISYTTPQTYTVNTAITPLAPQNTGGAVPATVYGLVSTFAGSGAMGSANGVANTATFNYVTGIVVDAAGNVYVADTHNNLIRKITPAGVVTNFAGSGTQGSANGQGTAAGFYWPEGLAIDAAGNIYVADTGNNLIRKINPSGSVSTLAGDGGAGWTDGAGTAASFFNPTGLVFDVGGNLYVSDESSNIIRKITITGQVTTIAGLAGASGTTDGTGTAARFLTPAYLAIDASGNIYVTVYSNNIRKITPTGVVTTFAGNSVAGFANGMGTAASFSDPQGIVTDALGNLYVADTFNNLIRRITPTGTVTTFAGNGSGSANGPLLTASFKLPWGLATDGAGNLYITDLNNNLVRKILLTGYAIDKTLPPGLIFDPTTGIISGTPTATFPATDYTVTAYNSGGSSSAIINISVNSVSPLITATAANGTITACAGTPSASPNIQQFTVSGSNLASNITATAPAGFEVSLAAGSGYGGSVSLAQTGGALSNMVVYVRSAASAPAGNISGNVVLTSGPASQNVAVTGTINALPTVNAVANQTLTNGAATTAVNFTGTGNTFTWVNDNPNIGLPASGAGNFASFTTGNFGTSPVTANITVTPVNSTGCAGTPITFTITVNPSPIITASAATGSISAIAGTASASPNVQQFTVSGNNLIADIVAAAPTGFEISLTASGGYGSSLTLTQSGGSVNNTVIYVRSSSPATQGNISGYVLVTSTGAAGQNVAVTGAINPPTRIPNQVVANGMSTTPVIFPGLSCIYNWVNDTPGIGLAASGTGNIAPFAAVNNGSSPVIATITATPANGAFAYIANTGSNDVTVINTATNNVVASIIVGTAPIGVAVSPDGSRVYVTNQKSNNVSVISTITNKVVDTITVGPATGSSPAGISVSPDGTRVYVANSAAGTVVVIDATTNKVASTITVGSVPQQIAISPDGSLLYVTNFSGKVSVINTTTNAIVSTITVGSDPSGISISADGSRVYVVNSGPGTVSVINTASNAVISTITAGKTPLCSSLSADGSRLYIANSASNSVSVINTATNLLLSNITVGSAPIGVSISPDGTLLYVANSTDNTVSVIKTATGAVTTTVAVGTTPNSYGRFVATVGCNSAPFTFTITVTAGPAPITASAVSGNISACAGSASVSPNIQQFTVSGSNLAADIVATAPSGFEISLAAGSGYGSSLMLPQSGGSVSSTTIYVRAASSAPAGNISGKVVFSSGTAGQNVLVNGIVSALATANTVANQTVSNGGATTAINFTGTANTFIWVNDTPGIGLASNGTGNIASFTAANTGSSPVIATITATPLSFGFAYIANSGSNTVSVINTITNKVVTTIAAGTQPYGVSVSPDSKLVYITNEVSNNVSVINTAANAVIATIPVGLFPISIAVSPDSSHVYVANGSSNSVSVINAATNSVQTTIGVGMQPSGIAVSPGGKLVYVANSGSKSVSVINAATSTVTTAIPVGDFPFGLTLSPDGSQLYVTNINDYTVSVINTATNAVTATIAVGKLPHGIAISPDGGRVYIVNYGSNMASVISTATNTVVAAIPVGSNPYGVSVSPDGSQVYVTNSADNTVSVINATTNAVSSTIPVGVGPGAFGNFISAGVNCTGPPVTFTITVNPASSGPGGNPNSPPPPPHAPNVAGTTIFVPNAFTPNGDGINDTWDIQNLESYPNSTVEIVNRYGAKVFYSVNYPVAWNGKYGGSDLPAGTYYYIINLHNGSKPVAGWVAIIR